MKEEEINEIEDLARNLGNVLTLISKGKAWIEVDEEKQTIRMTGLTNEDAKQAGIIQIMFNEVNKKKKMDIQKIQKALDYFGWNLFLIKENNGVSFRGEDKFLLVQIAHYMGGVSSKKYAEMYRDALKEGQKVFI